MDISPWINDAAGWYGAFNMGDFTYHQYLRRRDRRRTALKIRNANAMTWKSVHDLTHKPIIADDGYGVSGSPTFHDDTWDDS